MAKILKAICFNMDTGEMLPPDEDAWAYYSDYCRRKGPSNRLAYSDKGSGDDLGKPFDWSRLCDPSEREYRLEYRKAMGAKIKDAIRRRRAASPGGG